MARLVEIDTQDILQAARELLLEKGANITAAEIAKRIGISEGSIFTRFKTKSDLLKQAVFDVLTKDWFMAIDHYQQGDDYQQALIDSLVESLKCLRLGMPMHMMAISMFGGKDKLEAIYKKHHMKPTPVRIHKRFTDFLSRLVDEKIIKPCDLSSIGSMLVGGMIHRVVMEQSGSLEKNHKMKDHEIAEEIVSVMFKGLLYK